MPSRPYSSTRARAELAKRMRSAPSRAMAATWALPSPPPPMDISTLR